MQIIDGWFDLSPEEKQLVNQQKELTIVVNKKHVQVGAIWDKPVSKAPEDSEWFAVTPEKGNVVLSDWLEGHKFWMSNVGFNLQLGWLDVDVDSLNDEYVALFFRVCERLGISTRYRFGRSSRKIPTHFFVQLSEEDAAQYEYLSRFQPKAITLDGQRSHIELRSSPVGIDPKKAKVAAKQTVVPGSVYIRKDDTSKPDFIVWYTKGGHIAGKIDQIATTTPSRISYYTLVDAAAFATIAHYILPHWTEGQRQNTAVKLTGWLARVVTESAAISGHDMVSGEVYCPIRSDEAAEKLIKLICDETEDPEEYMRVRAYYDAKAKLERNPDAKVPGWNSLQQLIGNEGFVAIKTVVLPGSDISTMTKLAENYIYDKSENAYIDREMFRHRIQFVYPTEYLVTRHKPDVIFINGKPKEAFRVFECSKLRKNISMRDMYPDLEPGAIIRMNSDGEPVSDEDEDETARMVFNSWRGWRIKPAEKVDPVLMAKCVSYLDRLLGYLTNGNVKQVEWIKKWVAWTIQHPGDKQQISWVVVGGQGVGKSFFGDTLMLAILGEDLWGSASPSILEGVFSVAPFIGKMFVFVDEAKFHQPQAVEEVKKLIRSVNIPGQEKGKDARTHRIFARMMFASNELRTNMSQKDVRDRALYYTVARNPDNSGLGHAGFMEWANSLKPWFLEFADMLKRATVKEHIMRYFMDLPVTKIEVEDNTNSSINDTEVVETNASLARVLARSILESGWIIDSHTAWETPFSETQWIARVQEELKNRGIPSKVPHDVIFKELQMGQKTKYQEKCNGVNKALRRWPIRWGDHIKTFTEATSLEVTPWRELDDADYGENHVTLKKSEGRRGVKASIESKL